MSSLRILSYTKGNNINLQSSNTKDTEQSNSVALRKLQVADWGNRKNGDQKVCNRIDCRKCVPPAIFINASFVCDIFVPRSLKRDTLEDCDEDRCDCPCGNEDQINLSDTLEGLCNEDSEVEKDNGGLCEAKCDLVGSLGDKEPLLKCKNPGRASSVVTSHHVP